MFADLGFWAAIKRAGAPVTGFYLLSMLDLQTNAEGDIVGVDRGRAVYKQILGRTMYISLLVTLLTLILGFPVAYVLANTCRRAPPIC